MAGPASSARGTFPPEYKRRMAQGVMAWALLMLCLCGWIMLRSGATLKDINARIPQATAQVKTVYLTPQIEDDGAAVTFDNTGTAGTALAAGQGAYISLVITDLGLSVEETKRAIADMPEAVALALSPYGDLPGWITKAREAKHEVLALIPMEPDNFPKNDPGPMALLTRVAADDNAANLASVLRQSNGASGVMNFMGSAFLRNKKNLAPVFDTLKKAGATFVENRRGADTVAADTAKEAGLPYLSTDLEIDSSATETDVAQKLVELENLARERGYAVGIAAPYPVSFNLIKAWAEKLDSRGIKLIPLSAMVKVQQRAAPASPPVTPAVTTPPPATGPADAPG